MPQTLTSFQTNLANLDGTTDHVKSQRSERIDFYRKYKEADTKMFAHVKFLGDKIRVNRVIIVWPDSYVAVISLYQSVTNLLILDALWFKISTSDDQRYIPIHVLTSELGLPICCLLPAMHTNTRKKTTFQILKKIATK